MTLSSKIYKNAFSKKKKIYIYIYIYKSKSTLWKACTYVWSMGTSVSVFSPFDYKKLKKKKKYFRLVYSRVVLEILGDHLKAGKSFFGESVIRGYIYKWSVIP